MALANQRTGGYLGLELKFLDCAWNSVAINVSTDGSSGEVQPSTGCTGCISCPAQGDGESQRDGRKFTVKSVWLSGIVESTPVAGASTIDETNGYYVALVLDTQANGATIVSEDCFINPSTNGNAILPKPLRNLQNAKRFRILDAKYVRPSVLAVGQDAATTMVTVPGYQAAVNLSWRGNIVVETKGTTADVASVTDNAIHFIAYRGSHYTTTFVGKSRMRFYG